MSEQLFEENERLFEEACQYIPGGVNSPVRAFRSVGGTPRFIVRAKDAYIWDEEDVRYIDYLGSWGPAIVGHANDEVLSVVCAAASRGLSFGTPTRGEVELAKMICDLIPSVHQVRLVSTGTEATMSAIRLARGYTGRKKFIKFDGCYHGHSDSLLVKAGSGLQTFNNPTSSGVPDDLIRDTIVLDYNDISEVERVFEEDGYDIACVIVEPIAGNMNLVKPQENFLADLRKLCDQFNTVLIFDEVMTGFRVALGGAQALYGVEPDLTTFAKVIGGGMPVGAFGGRKEIMAQLAPLGSVYQAGTLSGNPVSVAAGLKTLEIVSREGFYETLSAQTQKLVEGLKRIAQEEGVIFNADYVGGMFGLYFREDVPTNLAQAMDVDSEAFKVFFHAMLEGGVHLAPSAYESCFISIKHTDEVIAKTLEVAREAFARVKQFKDQQDPT